MSERIEGTRRAVATAGVLGGTFLAAIETTVVAAAMPTVADQLGGLSYYSWVFSAYLLTSTVSIPLWGKLSDLYGRRRFYLSCVGLFLVGSALSGAAQTMPQLILFRALQGFGAGGLLEAGCEGLGVMEGALEFPCIFRSVGIVARVATRRTVTGNSSNFLWSPSRDRTIA